MIIDTFAHCSRKKFLPIEELARVSARLSIRGTLLIQHEGEFDHSYLASIVAGSPDRYKAVCMINTNASDASKYLEGLLDGTELGAAFVGARMTRNMIDEGTKCLDVLDTHRGTIVVHLPDGIDRHIDMLEKMARTYRGMTIYVPHMGWPVLDDRLLPEWRAAVWQLSNFQNVIFGVSALHHFSATGYAFDDTWPLVQYVVKTMGAERTVWASDFPLVLEGSTVEEYLRLFTEERLDLDRRELNAVLGATAARCWGFSDD